MRAEDRAVARSRDQDHIDLTALWIGAAVTAPIQAHFSASGRHKITGSVPGDDGEAAYFHIEALMLARMGSGPVMTILVEAG